MSNEMFCFLIDRDLGLNEDCRVFNNAEGELCYEVFDINTLVVKEKGCL